MGNMNSTLVVLPCGLELYLAATKAIGTLNI